MKNYKVLWTYRHTKIDNTKLPDIYTELNSFWEFLQEDTDVMMKSKFYFAPTDDIFKRICKTLCLELHRLSLYKYCTGIGFFSVPPGKITPIHIDMGYNYALNFPVINCENSYTVWYNGVTQVPTTEFNSQVDSDSILYKGHKNNKVLNQLIEAPDIPYFELDRNKEIDRVDSNQPLWINGSIPHRPEVQHLKYRLLATLRFETLPEEIFFKNTGLDLSEDNVI
jgi:hypothetical protein